MAFVQWSREQKMKYGSKFSKKERASYHKGRRYGFLIAVHRKDVGKRNDGVIKTHNYTKKQLDSFFTDLDKLKF